MEHFDKNFIFFGTPENASKTLEILIENGYIPFLVITNPDRPAGRGLALTKSPTKIVAEKYNIPVLTPEKIDTEFINILKNQISHMSDMWELNIVVAYGKILPEELINAPELGTINIHYSLLPKYRGASPVEACLLNGDIETGVSIQKMRYKLDSGPIISEEKIQIEPDETKIDLLEKLTLVGANLLIEILPNIFEDKTTEKEQDESQATITRKIKKEEGLLNLDDDPIKNYNKYRAFYNYPGTYFFFKDKRIKITKAKYEDGNFVIQKVIPENKKEIDFEKLEKPAR
jgi:methionyl-tRNA formyltransferase